MHQLIKYIRNASHLGLMRLQNCIDVKTKDGNKKNKALLCVSVMIGIINEC